MDIENLKRLKQKVLKLIPPRDVRKLQPKLKNASYTEFVSIAITYINNYSKKYKKRYYNLAKIILFEIKPPILNLNVWRENEEEFLDAANHNLAEFNEITIHYLKKINDKFPIDKIFNSLLIMMVITKDFADFPENIDFFEFQKQILGSFLYKVIDQDKERFDIYFFDWNLKLGYFIEGYLKEMLCMRLMIKNLLKDKDNSNLFLGTPMIGKILENLGEDMDQRIIRNAIFHSDFFLEYEIHWEERLITFNSLKFEEKREYSIKEFLTFFFETIQLVLTFGFILEYVHFLKINDGNEAVLEYLSQDSHKNFDYLISSLENFIKRNLIFR
ncbi:hypothetical protein LCGC14_0706070 [marine sediment metagenome]|uniref:Uncharacterized protein n=1 Tax=marine sediment metagenome TaxID=412755 RepID=A0A0F9T2E3_9ZZZZ|nr:hypothetical protein [bacterium]